jgi:uncharacterized protein (DUF58 family)
MQTDSFMDARAGKRLARRRSWYVLALALFVLSMIVQQPLLFLAALFSFVVGIVPGLWYHQALRHLLVRQQVSSQHLFCGEEVVLTLSIENQKLFPVPWLQVADNVTPLLPVLTKDGAQRENVGNLVQAWVLWPLQRVTRRYRLRCAARGCYTFGPVTLRTSDPFGWLEREVTVPLSDTLLVYPLLAPPAAFGLAPLHPYGEDATVRHLLEDPLRVMGVRDYQPGDDPRRIHWKATAHAGALRSKVYEYSTQQRVLLLLDTGDASTLWTKMDADMQEFCIAAAASLAVWALDEGYMVGLLTNCAIRTLPRSDQAEVRHTPPPDASRMPEQPRTTELSAPGVSVPFACDHGQYEHLLATFARLVPYNNVPLENIIELGDAMFFPGTTVILVSAAPTLTQATVERLLDLRTRGIALQFVLTGDLEDKATPETYDVPIHYLGGREHWHELIKAVVGEKSQGTGTRAVQFQLD